MTRPQAGGPDEQVASQLIAGDRPIRQPASFLLSLRPMLLQRLRKRLAAEARFIEPCLPSPAEKPPSGSNWIHEIKHDGYRLMARRDPAGIRLLTRRGNDWSSRFALVAEAVNHLKVHSCLIDGEVVCCDDNGVAAFQLLRHRRNEPRAFLYAFDLLELNARTYGGSRSRCARRPWQASCGRAGQVCV
jgi:ATP-dependent DNA ligase